MKKLFTRLFALVCACLLCVPAVCPVWAEDPPTSGTDEPETTLQLVQTSIQVTVNQAKELNVVVSDRNTEIEWYSNDTDIATVTPLPKNNRAATVTGVSAGTTEIKVFAYNKSGILVAEGTCSVTVNSVPVDSITLSPSKLELEAGDTYRLIPTVNAGGTPPTNPDITWTSSNDTVATVDQSGNVTAVAQGSATITATAVDNKAKTATCEVTVNPRTTIKLDKTLELTVGTNGNLTVTVTPTSVPTVLWDSSDESVVKVSQTTSTTCTLTPVAYGKARVSATVNGKTAFCDVTVYEKLTKLTLYNGRQELSGTDTLTLEAGSRLTLTPQVTPYGAKDTATWSSSDQSVVTVIGGVLEAKAPGEATITATASADNTKTATVKVKVIRSAGDIELSNSAYTLDLSDANLKTVALTATLKGEPSEGQKTVAWVSDNPDVASVSFAETTAGNDNKTAATVTAKKTGTATITATTKGGKEAKCTITVIKSPTELKLEVVESPDATATPGGGSDPSLITVSTPVGTKVKLKATITPADATNQLGRQLSITWSSGNTKTASVAPATSRVEGGSAVATVTNRNNIQGTVTITATAGGKKASCTITYTPVAVTGVKLDQTSATVSAGSFINLTATVEPSNASDKSVYWTSSDTSVAQVDAGNELKKKVECLKPGTAIITVTTVDGKKTASCTVTVNDTPVTGVAINPKDRKFILPGANGDKTLDLTAILTPKEAVKNTVTWTSSDEKVAKVYAKTVDSVQNDKIGVVTMGSTPGEATITASVGDIKDAVTVAVSGVVLEPNELKLAVREDKYVTRKLYGAALTVSSTDWEWSSSNDKIARVNPTSGQITGVAVGKATITCKNGDYSASIPVTVSANSESVITASLSGGQLNFSSIASRINAQAGGKLSYVTSLSVSPDEGTLYYGYVAEGDTGAGVSASDSFYYSGSGTKKLLGKVIFVPRAGFAGTADISYTAIDSSGDNHPGTIQVTVGAASQISYTCPQGECVYFHSDDFTNYCKGLYGYPIASVRFSTPPAERCGYLYYEYAGGEVFGSNVSASKRYFSSSTPALDSVAFVPRADYAGSFTLTYTGWDTAGNSFSGSIRITVTGKAGQVQPGDISYAAHSGKRLYFDVSDFADLCRQTTGRTLSYVQFPDLGDAYGKARLYAGTSGNSSLYAGRAYYNSTGGSYRLMDVNIVPYSTFTGTITIPFRAYDAANDSFTGRVLVEVTKDSGSADTIYKTSTGMPVSFQRSEFTQACDGQLPGELTSVRFYLPSESTGKLYASFGGLNDNRPLKENEELPAADLTALTFVLQGGFSGSAYLNYVARDERSNTCSGTVRVAVWPSAESGYFNDMKSYGWAVSSVDFLRRYGVVTGSTQTTYLPGQAMSRGDFVLMLARAYDLPGAGSRSFPDVPANSYYAQAIASARQRGIATGDPRGNFNPKSSLSRQEAAVFLYRTMQANGTAVLGSDYDLARFPDGDKVAGYAREAMASLAGLGVFQGDGQGRLNPTAPLSRAEMAVILHRAIT